MDASPRGHSPWLLEDFEDRELRLKGDGGLPSPAIWDYRHPDRCLSGYMWVRPGNAVRRAAAHRLWRPDCHGSGTERWRVRLGQVVTGVSNREVCPLGEGAPQGLVGRREEEAGGLRDR